MPTQNTGPKYAGSGSGWTNSSSVGGNDGAYATATWTALFDGSSWTLTDTATLAASSFGVNVGGGIVGIYVEVEAKRSADPAGTLHAILTKDGSQSGSSKSLGAVATSDQLHAGGGASDLWGGSWSASDISGLGVQVWGTPDAGVQGTSTVSVDFVRVTVYYETPNAFSFTDVSDQPISTTVESNSVSITGITQPATVTVSGGEWRKNGGAWTSSSGTVSNNDSVQVRHTTSSNFNTAVNTTLTISGVSDTFTSTTTNADTTPDAFGFNDRNDAEPGVAYVSNETSITGINSPASVSVQFGGWYKNGVNQGENPGSVVNGDQVALGGTASSSFGGNTTVRLTVGGVEGTFSINTRAADVTPSQFTFTDASGAALSTQYTSNAVTMSGMDPGQDATVTFTLSGTAGSGHQYSKSGGAWTNFVHGTQTTIQNGQTLAVRFTTSNTSGAAHNVTVNVGGTVDTYTVTNTTQDTTPDPFTFTDNPNAAPSTVVQSNEITIAGIDTPSNVSFSTGGSGSSHEYRKRVAGVWGAWAALGATTVSVGDGLQVRLTSPAGEGQTALITMTVGGVSDTFNVTTVAPDSTPNQFVFVDVNDAGFGTTVESNSVTVSGINVASAISINGGGGEFSVNGGAWRTTATTVVNGDAVKVRIVSASSFATAVSTTLTIGGVSDTFNVTTRAPSPSSQYVLTFREARHGIDF